MSRSHFVFAVLAAALFVFAIGATWTVAQTDGVIHACANPAGQPRIVDAESDCKRNETYLSWNITGSKGEDGSAGLNCWDLNGNGVGDLPDEDRDGSLEVNVGDCQGDPGPKGGDGEDGQDGADGQPGFLSVYNGPTVVHELTEIARNTILRTRLTCDPNDPNDIAIGAAYDIPHSGRHLQSVGFAVNHPNSDGSWALGWDNQFSDTMWISGDFWAICLDMP